MTKQKLEITVKAAAHARYRTAVLTPKQFALFQQRGFAAISDRNQGGKLDWQENLILDYGLNAWAKQGGAQHNPSNSFDYCQIGSGTTPVAYPSGSITFTQATTTITASASFFTSAMVGGLFKWGTGSGGAELYISAVEVGGLSCTVTTSATVSTAAVGTVWMVQQSSLTAFIRSQDSYATGGSNCGYTTTGANITMQRTYIFLPPGSAQDVNELGWYGGGDGSHCFGRLVLSTTDVIGTSNYYVVQIQIGIDYSPASPVTVTSVGTSIDTSGTLALEAFACHVPSNTGTDATISADSSLDGESAVFGLITQTYSQNASPGAEAMGVMSAYVSVNYPDWARITSGLPGIMRFQSANESWTTAGETVYGIGLCSVGGTVGPCIDVLLANPFTLPVGPYVLSTQWTIQYTRELSN